MALVRCEKNGKPQVGAYVSSKFQAGYPSQCAPIYGQFLMAVSIVALLSGCAGTGEYSGPPVVSQQANVPSGQPAISQQANVPKATIAVLPFSDNRSQYEHKPYYDSWNGQENWQSQKLSEEAAAIIGQYPDKESLRMMCESSLGKYSFIKLTSRGNLNQILEEHRFQVDDYWSADTRKIYEIGKAIGAEYVLIGNLSGSQPEKGNSPYLHRLLRNFAFSVRMIHINSLETISGSASVNLGNYRSYGQWDGAFARPLDVQALVRDAVQDLTENYIVSSQNSSNSQNPSVDR